MSSFLSSPRATEITFAEPGGNKSFGSSLAEMFDGGNPVKTDVGTMFGFGVDDSPQPAPWARVLRAAVRNQEIVDNTYARQDALAEALDRRIADVESATGVTLQNYARRPPAISTMAGFTEEENADTGREDFYKKLAELQESFPQHAAKIRAGVPAEDDARGAAFAAGRELQAAMDDPELSAGGLLFGALGGGIAGSFRDPLQVSTLFAGGGAGTAANVGLRIGQVALREGLISAGVVAAMQPNVQAWRAEAGLESGVVPALENVGLAFLFGAIPGAVIEGGRALKPASFEMFERVLAGTATPAEVDRVTRELGSVLGSSDAAALRGAVREADRPTDPPPPGVARDSHEEIVAQAVRHAEDPVNQPPPELELALPVRPPDQVRVIDEAVPNNINETVQGKPVEFMRLDPRALTTDAATFQYKGNSDAAGVTDRLRHVTQWDATASGKGFVFERADGTRVIADGHQRLGLAKRLIGEQPDAPITIDAFVFREKDGWNAADVRALAAKKNMQEGSGDALDAARILRDRPDILDGSLPVSGPMMKNAIALARLSDEAFGMAINGVVAPNYAAAVGAMVPDPLQHAAVMADLVRFAPETEREARLLIGDVMASGFTAEEQISLFGAAPAARSLMGVRVKTLDAALQGLLRDKKLFGTLADKADAIESAGNVLARGVNEQRASDAARLAELVTRLAQRTGPVSDALNRAAAKVAEGAKPAAAADGFLDDLRALLDRDGLNALLASPELKPAQAIEPATPEALVAAETASAERFTAAAAPDRGGVQAMLDRGDPIEAIERHPVVQAARDQLYALRPSGTIEQFEDAAWRAARIFSFGGEQVQGYDAAIARLAGQAKAYAGAAVRNERQATIVIGPPAAGKSTISEQIARDLGAAIIDADDAKKVIPEYGGGVGTQAAHEESSVLARGVMSELVGEDANLVLPKIGSEPAGIARLGEVLRLRGYTVNLVHVSATPEISRRRNIQRFVKTGRLVPPEYIAQVGDKPHQVYYLLKGDFHETADLDASDPGQFALRDGTGALADRLRPGKDPGSGADQGRAGSQVQQTEVTAAGEQTLLPGVEAVSDRQRAELQAAKPLRGGDAAPPAGGLFDDGARAQVDLLDAIAVSDRADGKGTRFISRDAALEEADRSALHADLIKSCKD
jgi:predicted kinase